MALPTTVEFTLVASDPVPSALLMKLQQALVGDIHPERPLVLGPACWAVKLGGRGLGGTAAVQGDSQWVWGGGPNSVLTCDVLIPAGHELVDVQWFYTRGGAGTVTRSAYKRLLSTGAAEVAVIAATGDGAGAAWAGATDAALNLVLADYTALTLEVSLANAAHIFGGARINYRKLT